MTIQSFLRPNSAEVFAISATETVGSVAEQMRQQRVTALVVTSGEASAERWRIWSRRSTISTAGASARSLSELA